MNTDNTNSGRGAINAGQLDRDVWHVPKANTVPFQHPEFGPGIFFTEDAAEIELSKSAVSAPGAVEGKGT